MSVLTLRVVAKINQGIERDYQEDNFIIGTDPADNNWKVNDDEYKASPWGSILVVADGMGGLNAGEVASQQAVEGFQEYVAQLHSTPPPIDHAKDLLINAILAANTKILNYAKSNPEHQGMGTTIVVAWLVQDQMHVAWSGDSRCYQFSRGELKQVNFDHSYVQELVNKGEIKAEDAFFHPNKNIITQSLGDVGREPAPDYRSIRLSAGDRILLCSDGLNTMLTDEQIAGYLSTGNIRDCAELLVKAANDAGGYDNITVVLAEVIAVGEGAIVPVIQPEPAAVEVAGVAPVVPPGSTGNTMFKVTRQTLNMGLLVLIVAVLGLIVFMMFDSAPAKPLNSIDSIDSSRTKTSPFIKKNPTDTSHQRIESRIIDPLPPLNSEKGQSRNYNKKKETNTNTSTETQTQLTEDPYAEFKELIDKAITATNGIEKRELEIIRNNLYDADIMCKSIKKLEKSRSLFPSIEAVINYSEKKRYCVKPGSIGETGQKEIGGLRDDALKAQQKNNPPKVQWGIQLISGISIDNAKGIRDRIKSNEGYKITPYDVTVVKRSKNNHAVILIGFKDKKEASDSVDRLKKALDRSKSFVTSFMSNDIVTN